ncbi:MAG: hypothetical protein ABI340_04065, partial [Nitrososphaera sp.]
TQNKVFHCLLVMRMIRKHQTNRTIYQPKFNNRLKHRPKSTKSRNSKLIRKNIAEKTQRKLEHGKQNTIKKTKKKLEHGKQNITGERNLNNNKRHSDKELRKKIDKKIILVSDTLRLPSEYSDNEIASTVNVAGINIGVNKKGQAIFIYYYKEMEVAY